MPQHPQGHVFYRNMARAYPVVERGEGVYLYDADGRRYLDASGGPLVVNIGHGVRSVAEAMAAQAAQVAYVHGERFTTAALEAYSQRLAARVPLLDPRFYYLSGGAEAVEGAVKFARQLQVARGQAARDLVISRWGSYHGATLGTLALSGKPSMRAMFAPMFRDTPHVEPSYCYRCPFGALPADCSLPCARQLEAEILRHGPARVAAFIAEPVGGATLGAIVPPAGYWPLIRDICDRYGVLLIADEVLTGFGRTGTWFAMEQFGVRPDLMVMAKGVAGGYFPLSILAVRNPDVETIRRAHGSFNHGGTFSHHAVGAAAALATFDYLEAHDLIARAAALGAALGQKLRDALGDLPSVGDVRGIGMVWAVEFVADRQTRAPYPAAAHFADRVCARAMDLGVLFYPGHGSADGVQGDHLLIAPPFVVTEPELDTIVQALRQAILDADPKGFSSTPRVCRSQENERIMTATDPTLRDIYLARQRIAGLARRTPLVRSAGLSERAGAAVYLKLECLQETGSFKIRGAANKLLSLTDEERVRGVVAVSSGNHGRAVAHVAGQLGVRAVICVSERVPAGKVEAIRRLGAEVVVHGASYDEAEANSLRLQAERGLTRVDPFDDPAVIAGQGTVGLELLEDLPRLETVVVPLSGGGLIAGIAIALKAANPAVRVIGASMDRAPVMIHSLRAGRPLELPEEDTLADALAGGIGLDNRYTFRLVQRYVDETLLVSEDEIAGAMAFALEQERLVVEGGGAVALAALLYGKVSEPGRTIAVVLSGANVDLPLLSRLILRGATPKNH